MLWFSKYGVLLQYVTFLASALSFERGEEGDTITLVGVQSLFLDAALVEIEGQAVLAG